jgi:hypothetical protein
MLDRIKAYAILAEELARFRLLPHGELVRLIGGPAIDKSLGDAASPLTIEVRIEWADDRGQAVRIRATASGPGWWRMERMEESALIPTPAADE